MTFNEYFCDAGYIRCGVSCELMLHIVSFKNAGDADSCGWESSQARGDIEYSRLIVPQRPAKKTSYSVSSESTYCDRCLLRLGTAAYEHCGASVTFDRWWCRVVVLLQSALAATA